jgi:hypothetical protein
LQILLITNINFAMLSSIPQFRTVHRVRLPSNVLLVHHRGITVGFLLIASGSYIIERHSARDMRRNHDPDKSARNEAQMVHGKEPCFLSRDETLEIAAHFTASATSGSGGEVISRRHGSCTSIPPDDPRIHGSAL